MSRSQVAQYFESLHRQELSSVNEKLQQHCLTKSQSTTFQTDGVIVVDDVYDATEISNARLAFQRLEALVQDDIRDPCRVSLTGNGNSR